MRPSRRSSTRLRCRPRDPLHPARAVGGRGPGRGRSAGGSSRGPTRTRGRARLPLREVRPERLGGRQPPREIRVPPQGDVRETVAVVPVRRGRERAGAFVVDSTGPLGLGRRRSALALPWDAAVYPPLLTLRLRASVAEAARRPHGVTPIRP